METIAYTKVGHEKLDPSLKHPTNNPEKGHSFSFFQVKEDMACTCLLFQGSNDTQ